jgi:HEAT repeat protein
LKKLNRTAVNRYLKLIAENGLNSYKLELEAISLLRQSKAAIAAEQLIGFLDSRHQESVKKAGWALADLGNESVETLLSMFSSEDPYLRWKCAFILGKILERNRNRGEAVNMVITNALENLIDDPSLEVRYIAGLALGESCSKESAKHLSILSNERDPGMKAMANHLLNRLDSSQNMNLEGHPVFISRVSEKETAHK